MLPDFSLIQRHFTDNKDVCVVPISDVHLGAAEHMEAAWREFRTSVLQDTSIYLILSGDLVNNGIRNSVSNIYEEVLRPREQKKRMTEMLEPLRDRILCAVPGNHEARSSREVDDDIVYDIMCKLDLEDLYRENIAFLKIQIGNVDGDGKRNPTYILTTAHGSGGGIMTGGAVNRAERFAYALDGCDIFIQGHTHKPWVSHPGKIKIDSQNNRVSVKPFHVVNASSWLEFGGYACKKLLLPSSHVAQKIVLSGTSKNIKIEIG